jgi:hypothetical protein
LDEVPTRIEPCGFEDGLPARLALLAERLLTASADLGKGLPEPAARAAAEAVLVAEARHSALIEGVDLAPGALAASDGGAAAGMMDALRWATEADPSERPAATSRDFALAAHRRMFGHTGSGLEPSARPGVFRILPHEEIVVGRHRPPSPARVSEFMRHFSWRYGRASPTPEGVVKIAAAHHRFTYIHPFVDGNGRTARAMSVAMCREAGIRGKGLWSLSRALRLGRPGGRGYAAMLDHADSPRAGDLDGRGNLSRRALADFCEWFLLAILDEIEFASGLFDPPRLAERLRAEGERVVPGGGSALAALFGGNGAEPGEAPSAALSRAGFRKSANGAPVLAIERHAVLVPGLFDR